MVTNPEQIMKEYRVKRKKVMLKVSEKAIVSKNKRFRTIVTKLFPRWEKINASIPASKIVSLGTIVFVNDVPQSWNVIFIEDGEAIKFTVLAAYDQVVEMTSETFFLNKKFNLLMTKPKIANGNCINPISRLEKRLDEYKRCHQDASKNCNKAQESHNKSNDALKALLERKSKLSDSKIKKKRSAATTAINRKKAKPNTEQLQSVSGFFDNHIDATPNVTLNVNASEFPDFDYDSFDILNNPNFSMSINEQELEGVLNNCYSHPVPVSAVVAAAAAVAAGADIKTTQNNNADNCKTSPSTKNDSHFFLNSVNAFKNDDAIFPPLFPPPENHSQSTVKFEYVSPPNYLSSTTNCNYNPSVSMSQLNNSSMYSMNLGAVNSTNSLSYQYHNPLVPEPINNTNTTQYFYQYPSYSGGGGGVSTISDNGANCGIDNFQLPAMSTGWYNTLPATNNIKPVSCKQTMVQPQPHQQQQLQQQQQFINTSIAIGNYRGGNYDQYHPMTQQADTTPQMTAQYHQMYVNPIQSYDPGHGTSYAMIPDQQQSPYYYMDYRNNGGARTVIPSITTNNFNVNNNRAVLGQNDPRLLSHQANSALLCRNVYQ